MQSCGLGYRGGLVSELSSLKQIPRLMPAANNLRLGSTREIVFGSEFGIKIASCRKHSTPRSNSTSIATLFYEKSYF